MALLIYMCWDYAVERRELPMEAASKRFHELWGGGEKCLGVAVTDAGKVILYERGLPPFVQSKLLGHLDAEAASRPQERVSRAGRPRKCFHCGKRTESDLKDENNKRICESCEKECVSCGNEASPGLRDESGGRLCLACYEVGD